MVTALFPATFDPITNGHVDIAERAAAIFERVIMAVFDHNHPIKSPLFSTQERLDMVVEAVSHLDNVGVSAYCGLTAEYARSESALVLIRGLRVVSDFESEFKMAHMNRQLAPEIETVCLMASPENAFLSSSLVKEVALLGGDVSDMVPPATARALQAKAETLTAETT
ncbi:MAG: Phosphopantetheine adenylyltransferase [Anaerolineales bacterium]|nr:Phosphopantetheine adenylyltransferase [Anaerolineales bacterium]